MNKLDKIIDEYAHEHHSLLKTKLKELFQDLIDEVIGEDESYDLLQEIENSEFDLKARSKEAKNILRQEQRHRAKELLEEL